MQEWKLLGKSEIEVSELLKKFLKKFLKKKKKKKKRKAVNREVDDVSTGSLRQAVPVKHITIHLSRLFIGAATSNCRYSFCRRQSLFHIAVKYMEREARMICFNCFNALVCRWRPNKGKSHDDILKHSDSKFAQFSVYSAHGGNAEDSPSQRFTPITREEAHRVDGGYRIRYRGRQRGIKCFHGSD